MRKFDYLKFLETPLIQLRRIESKLDENNKKDSNNINKMKSKYITFSNSIEYSIDNKKEIEYIPISPIGTTMYRVNDIE